MDKFNFVGEKKFRIGYSSSQALFNYRADPVPEDDEEADAAVDQAEITAEEVKKFIFKCSLWNIITLHYYIKI